MKILHIFGELQHSGAERLLTSAAAYLINEHRQHSVLSTGAVKGDYASAMQEAGYDVIHIPFQRSVAFFWRLAAVIRHQKFDVIHVHMERGNFWTALTAIISGSKPIRTIHSDFAFHGPLRLRRRIQRRILSTLGVPHIACSYRVAANEKKRFGLTTPVIENWINSAELAPVTPERRAKARTKLSVSPDSFLAISIGNYSPVKNHPTIIAAIRACRDGIPIVYFHCGNGEAALARDVGITDEDPVHLQGAVSNVDDYLTAADAFISASAYEGGPMALLEAAAVGIPCITTNVGMAPLLAGLPNVYYVEPTPDSIAAALQKVAALSVDRRVSGGSALSSYVLRRFTPSEGANKYLRFYAALTRKAEA